MLPSSKYVCASIGGELHAGVGFDCAIRILDAESGTQEMHALKLRTYLRIILRRVMLM